MNIPEDIRDYATRYPDLEEWATGGGMDFIVKPITPRADLILTGSECDESPDSLDSPAIVTLTRSCEEQHDWGDTHNTDYEYHKGTARECLDFMAAHDVEPHTIELYLVIWGDGYEPPEEYHDRPGACWSQQQNFEFFNEDEGFNDHDMAQISALHVGEAYTIADLGNSMSVVRIK